MEEDENELIPESDNESLSDSEEQSLPERNITRRSLMYVDHTKTEFLIVKISLIFLTTSILILFPLYIETVNTHGNVYSLILTNSVLSTVVLAVLMVALKLLVTKYKHIHIFKLPIKLPKLAQISFIYFLSAFMIVYALDRKRVVCHLQDPVKGLVLIWSFLYYFFFCQRFMCLQRILSVTVVVVGLFIAVDYSLCNEFRCRGYERERISDDKGQWTWQIHAIWTAVYIAGLAVYAAYVTVLEHTFLNASEMLLEVNLDSVSTISHSDSTSVDCLTQDTPTNHNLQKKLNSLHLATWLHIVGTIIVAVFCWINFIPGVGKGSSASSFLNYTFNGIRCHFDFIDEECYNLSIYSWLFLFAYVLWVVAFIQFLMITQCSVYTIATMTTALPLVGIWWSLVKMVSLDSGLLAWNLIFSGEIISAILGLPVIIVGLYFLFKSHFKDCRCS